MTGAAVQPPTIFQRDNLLKSPDTTLDCGGRAYDIEIKARGLLRGCGSHSLNA